jgi:phage tail-like protein
VRRRRLLTRGAGGPLVEQEAPGTDLTCLEHLVIVRFPVASARTYLHRSIGNEVRLRLVEARRGERVGVVRAVEVRHANSGEQTMITGRRVLANGEPASFFVPDHLVRVEPVIDGPAAYTGTLSTRDVIVLHVPVRGYLRFLPGIFQGEGPVSAASGTRALGNALQRAGGGAPPSTALVETELDEGPMRRFLFLFQHVMTTVTDRIDHIDQITDPLLCEPRLLPWLASWVGFELDESLPVHQQRELVRRAIRLYRSRGTRVGLEEMVGVLTSAPVRVRERARPQAVVLGRAHLVGGEDVVGRYHRNELLGAYLIDPTSHVDTDFFVLLLESRASFRERFGERAPHVLRRIADVVSRERPHHVAFTLRFDETA